MTFEELKEHYKTSYEFEKRTGFSHVSWLRWQRIGYVPYFSQLRLQRITDGLFTADLSHAPEGKI